MELGRIGRLDVVRVEDDIVEEFILMSFIEIIYEIELLSSEQAQEITLQLSPCVSVSCKGLPKLCSDIGSIILVICVMAVVGG
jgi:hypothetical protein